MRASCQYPWNVLHLVVYFKHPICVKVYNGKVVFAGHSLVAEPQIKAPGPRRYV